MEMTVLILFRVLQFHPEGTAETLNQALSRTVLQTDHNTFGEDLLTLCLLS